MVVVEKQITKPAKGQKSKKEEKPQLSPEEQKQARARRLQTSCMMSDREAERALRNHKELTDEVAERVAYKYAMDAQSMAMNKNRKLQAPKPNRRPHRQRQRSSGGFRRGAGGGEG